MSDLLDENLLSFLKDEYKIIKSSPRCGISYILVIENKLSTEHEVLKVIDVRDVPKEKIQEYLSALEVVNKINDEHNYLVKYSMIKEENGYIYLKMREFIGSLDVEDINIYPIYENMMSKDYKEKTEEEEEEEDHRIVCGYVREEEDDDEDDDENNHKKKKSQKKKKNEPKKIEYKCRKGSYRYNAYYDICYSVYLLHSNNLIHGNISKKNIFYYNKHFYLSDYCQYLLHDVDITEKVDDDMHYTTVRSRKVYVGNKKEDISSLGYIQEYLSKIVTGRSFYDRYNKIDEDSNPDALVQRLWEDTQDGEYCIEEILKKLNKLKVKEWENEYGFDPETESCMYDEIDRSRDECKSLRKKISGLRAKIFAFEKEKEEYIKRIRELENENESLTKGNNELSVKRKKLTD